MITKCCIVCLCITASTMLGLAHAKSKRARVRYFDACVRLTDVLIAEMSFRRDGLTDVLCAFAENEKSELKAHITAFCLAPYEAFVPAGKLLKADEKRLVTEFFGALGTTDAQTQVFALQGYKQRFGELYAQESDLYRRTGTVGLKLSVLLGLAVGILLL